MPHHNHTCIPQAKKVSIYMAKCFTAFASKYISHITTQVPTNNYS